MKTRIAHILIALSLVLAAFAGMPHSARANIPDEIYLPWVANGTMIDDPRGFESLGPFYSSVTIQNPHDMTILVEYTVTANGELEDVLLDAFQSATLNAAAFGIPAGTGSGIVLRGKTLENFPMPIAAVVKQSSPVPQESMAITTGNHVTSAGYTGLVAQEIDGEIVLPIVQTNSNWNTLIRVTNFDPVVHSQTHLWLHESGGGASIGPIVQQTPPGQTTTFDLLDLGVPEGWVGSAVIKSGSLGAVAERVKNETKMLVLNTSRSTDVPEDEQFAALVFRDWFHWNTGISLANLAEVDNDVTVRYYAPDGSEVHSTNLTLPANGMDFLYLPSGAGDEAFVGSAIIEAEEPFVGSVDEVKYLGEADDTGHAMSYMVDDLGVGDRHRSLMLPLYQRGDEDLSTGDTTGIQIFNPAADPLDIEITVYAQNGSVALASALTLQPKHGHTFYAFDDLGALAPGFTGSVVIRGTNLEGSGRMVAVSNNVNYAVEYDGSASFNLIRANLLICLDQCPGG
jgi:hypothetical protein